MVVQVFATKMVRKLYVHVKKDTNLLKMVFLVTKSIHVTRRTKEVANKRVTNKVNFSRLIISPNF